MRLPDQISAEFGYRINGIREKAEAIVDRLVVKELVARQTPITRAESVELLIKLRRELSSVVDREATARYVTSLAKRIDSFNRKQVAQSLAVRAPEIANGTVSTWVRQSVRATLEIPVTYRKRVADVLTKGVERGSRVETMAKQLEDGLGIERREAAKIAETQVLSANSRMTEERHKKLGVERYVWQDSGDTAVRAWHHKLNGTVCSYANPPVGGGAGPKDTGNAGSSRRCRCQAIPVIDRFQ